MIRFAHPPALEAEYFLSRLFDESTERDAVYFWMGEVDFQEVGYWSSF